MFQNYFYKKDIHTIFLQFKTFRGLKTQLNKQSIVSIHIVFERRKERKIGKGKQKRTEIKDHERK